MGGRVHAGDLGKGKQVSKVWLPAWVFSRRSKQSNVACRAGRETEGKEAEVGQVWGAACVQKGRARGLWRWAMWEGSPRGKEKRKAEQAG